MKAVRATLILVPLLGIQYVLLPYKPEGRVSSEIYDYVMHILMNYQVGLGCRGVEAFVGIYDRVELAHNCLGYNIASKLISTEISAQLQKELEPILCFSLGCSSSFNFAMVFYSRLFCCAFEPWNVWQSCQQVCLLCFVSWIFGTKWKLFHSALSPVAQNTEYISCSVSSLEMLLCQELMLLSANAVVVVTKVTET